MSNDGNKSTKRAPFTIFSSSAEGGYLDDLHANFTDGVTLANMHTDTYGDFRNPPMQGPFTEKHVGGMPHRHTKIILAGDLEFITANIDAAEGYWDETPVYVTPLDSPPVGTDTVWELSGSGDLMPLTASAIVDNTIWELVDADTAISPGEPDISSHWRVYKTDCKPEGFYIVPAASELNLYGPDFRSDVPRSWLYRDEFAKRPLNIRNIKTGNTTPSGSCTGAGNYSHEYEVVQIAGRTLNPRAYARFPESYTTNYALNYGTEGKVFNNLTGALNTPATGTLPDYAMPNNTSKKVTNNFIFVNKFSAPGDRYTMSRGFLNPHGEEMSVYNASPFRNLNVRKELSEDLATHTPKATDIPPDSPTKYHTTNRNSRLRKGIIYGVDRSGWDYTPAEDLTNTGAPDFEPEGCTDPAACNYTVNAISDNGSCTYGTCPDTDNIVEEVVYDDGYVTHAIPRSTLQYSWIGASAETTRSEFPGFATGSDIQFYSNSVGFDSPMNNVYIDPDAGTQSFDFTGSVYGYNSWKEIRGGELALSRYYRNHNILPVANAKDEVSQYIEPPVVARNFPLEFIVAIDKSGAPFRIKSAYGSMLQRYSNEEINKLFDITASDKNTRYSQIKKLYLDKSVTDVNNPIKAFYSLTYGQTLYPKDENAFMGKVRLRGKYTEVPGTGSRGYDRLYGTQNTMYSTTLMRDPTAKNSQGVVDISLAFDPMRTDGILSFPDSGSYSGNVGELNLDTDISLTSSTAPTSSLDFFETNYIKVDGTSSDYNERLVEQMSGKTRWYNSYEDYAENTRGIMKEASILPEFRISEHMEYYTNDSAGNFRAENKNFLSLLGAEYSSSAESATSVTFDAAFENTYLDSDELASLDKIKKDHIGYAKPSKITLKASGVKKLLPYNGFYPDTRTVQLGNLLSSSMAESVSGYRIDATNPLLAERFLYESPPHGLAAVTHTLASPGVLYNTLKSGIAVDYPLYDEQPQVKSFLPNPTGRVVLSPTAPPADRLPFESLVNLNKNYPSKQRVFLAPGGALTASNFEDSSRYYGVWDGNKKPFFELGMHNFLAESVEMFLEKGRLNAFTSKEQSEFLDVKEDKKYYMDVVLRDDTQMNKFVSYGGVSSSFPVYETLNDNLGHIATHWQSIPGSTAVLADNAGGAYVLWGEPENDKAYFTHVSPDGYTEDLGLSSGILTGSASGDKYGFDVAMVSGSDDNIYFVVSAPAAPRYSSPYEYSGEYSLYKYSYVSGLSFVDKNTTLLEVGMGYAVDMCVSGSNIYIATIPNAEGHIGSPAIDNRGYVSCFETLQPGFGMQPSGIFQLLEMSSSHMDVAITMGTSNDVSYDSTLVVGYLCSNLSSSHDFDYGAYGTHKGKGTAVAFFTSSLVAPVGYHTFSVPASTNQNLGSFLYAMTASITSGPGAFDAQRAGGAISAVSYNDATSTADYPNVMDFVVFTTNRYELGTTGTGQYKPRIQGIKIFDPDITNRTVPTTAYSGGNGRVHTLVTTMDYLDRPYYASLDLVKKEDTYDNEPTGSFLMAYGKAVEPPYLYERPDSIVSEIRRTHWNSSLADPVLSYQTDGTPIDIEPPPGNYRDAPASFGEAVSVSLDSSGNAYYACGQPMYSDVENSVSGAGAVHLVYDGPRPKTFLQDGSLFGIPIDNAYDPHYCMYTPPGFYGASIATIEFSSSVGGKVSLDEIMAEASIAETYTLDSSRVATFEGVDLAIPSLPAGTNTSVGSSVSLLGKTLKPNIQFDVDTDGEQSSPTSATKNNSQESSQWVISTKYECPVVDNSSSLYSEHYTSHIDGLEDSPVWDIDPSSGHYSLPRSVWTSYGSPPLPERGYDFELRETPDKPADAGSLIELCGFTAGTKKIGTVADKKTISEAIMVIPYVDRKIPFKTVEIEKGKHFIRFSKTELKRQKKNVEDKGYAISEDNPITSISEMISGMKNYVIPPQYNFLQYDDIKPFAAYFLEFDHELSQRDLIDIWQGVMPTIAMNPETDEVEITHNFDAHNFFHNMEFPTDIKFMVFKVKKKANWNYYSITADSTDDTRFKFDFQGDGKVEVVPDYNYNWPYDYCSLVDRAKVDVSVTFEKDKKEEVK